MKALREKIYAPRIFDFTFPLKNAIQDFPFQLCHKSFQTGNAHENSLPLSHRWSDPAMAAPVLIRLLPPQKRAFPHFPFLNQSE